MVIALPQSVPVPLTSPIGREAEIATVRQQLLGGTLLLVLAGPGGVGKTRLALAIAADQRVPFAGDVVFVDCAAFTDAAQVLPAAARALRLDPAQAATLDALASALEQRRALLILDNLEQIEGAGELAARLVARTRQLVVVATSRIRLDVPSEVVVEVSPLATGPTGNSRTAGLVPAVQLFVERAQSAYPSFTLTPDNRQAVEAICRRLDGLPLAIELAAAPIPVLAPAAMLVRIEGQSAVSNHGDRNLPDRHRSLVATLDWSYALLGPVEQQRFRRLGVFAGSFDRAAAVAILRDDDGEKVSATAVSRQTGRWLVSLERQSLINRVLPELPGPRQRFDMLTTISAYAQSKLLRDPEHGSLAERHFAWFLGIATKAERYLNGARATQAMEWLDQDIANLRRALRFAEDIGRTADGIRLAVALWRYWESRGLLRGGADVFERLLARDDAAGLEPALHGTALNHLANLLADLGQFHRAAGFYAQSLAVRRTVGEPGPLADTLNNLGLLSGASGRFALAREQFGEALAIRRETDDRWGEALAIANLGDVDVMEGQAASAIALHEQALAIRTEIHDQRGIAFSSSNLAEACRLDGDRVRAGQLLRMALRRFRRLGVPFGEALVWRNLGDLDSDDGQFRRALEHYRAALDGFDRMGDRGRVAEVLERFGATGIALGSFRDGVAVIGAADRIRVEMGLVRAPIDRPRFDLAIETAQHALGDVVVDATLATGRVMKFPAVLLLLDGIAGNSLDRHEPDGRGTAGPVSASVVQQQAAPGLDTLTDREREVIALLAEGLSNAEIGHRLYISGYTVNAHLRRIFSQLGVTTRTAAVQRWLSETTV